MVCLVVCPATSWAHRPFTTEDAGVLAPGRYELELGHEYVDAGQGGWVSRGVGTLNAGLLPRVELDVTVPVTYAQRADGATARGVNDLVLAAKFAVTAPETGPAVTLIGEVAFPTGDDDRGLGAPDAEYAALAVVTMPWRRLTAHANAGWQFLSAGEGQALLRAAVSHDVTPAWALLLEWDGATDFASGGPDTQAGLLTGVLWRVSKHWTWDLGVRYGTTAADDPLAVRSGMTLAF